MIKVLIVDDESLARIRLQRLLEKNSDIEVVGEARNGLEAVQMAHQYLPAVVLMDVRMPEMDGLEAALHLKTLRCEHLMPKPSPIYLSRSKPMSWMGRCSEPQAQHVRSLMAKLRAIDAISVAGPTTALNWSP